MAGKRVSMMFDLFNPSNTSTAFSLSHSVHKACKICPAANVYSNEAMHAPGHMTMRRTGISVTDASVWARGRGYPRLRMRNKSVRIKSSMKTREVSDNACCSRFVGNPPRHSATAEPRGRFPVKRGLLAALLLAFAALPAIAADGDLDAGFNPNANSSVYRTAVQRGKGEEERG